MSTHASQLQDPAWRVSTLECLEHLDPARDRWDAELSALTMVFVDALLEADTATLEAAGDPLRDQIARFYRDDGAEREMRGWLTALLAVVRWSLQRLPSGEEIELRHNTQAWSFMVALRSGAPRTSSDLRTALGTGDSQISRVGRELLARGIVVQRRAGRQAIWELTPRGRKLVKQATERHDAEPDADDDAPRLRASGALRHSESVAALMAEAADPAAGVIRFVMPHPAGGWNVVKNPTGRRGLKLSTKRDAVQRAKKIVAKAGGGEVWPANRDGKLIADPLKVRPRKPA